LALTTISSFSDTLHVFVLTLAVVKIMLNREIENKIKNRFLTINAFFIMILN